MRQKGSEKRRDTEREAERRVRGEVQEMRIIDGEGRIGTAICMYTQKCMIPFGRVVHQL